MQIQFTRTWSHSICFLYELSFLLQLCVEALSMWGSFFSLPFLSGGLFTLVSENVSSAATREGSLCN